MADTDAVKEAKQFYEDVPMETPGFFLKGAGSHSGGSSRVHANQSESHAFKTGAYLTIDAVLYSVVR